MFCSLSLGQLELCTLGTNLHLGCLVSKISPLWVIPVHTFILSLRIYSQFIESTCIDGIGVAPCPMMCSAMTSVHAYYHLRTIKVYLNCSTFQFYLDHYRKPPSPVLFHYCDKCNSDHINSLSFSIGCRDSQEGRMDGAKLMHGSVPLVDDLFGECF